MGSRQQVPGRRPWWGKDELLLTAMLECSRTSCPIPSREEPVDRLGGELAVLHGGHRQVRADGDAVAAGPDVRQRGAAVLGHRDAVAIHLQPRAAVELRQRAHGLADGLEQHVGGRSEEHTSELQSLMRISYAVFCLKKKKQTNTNK